MENMDIELFKDKLKKQNICIVIWTIIVGIAVGFAIMGIVEMNKDIELFHLNDLIMSTEDNTYKNAYLDVYYEPYVFAEYDNESTKFYIVQDDEYMYIAYLTEDLYEIMQDKDLENDPYTIKGYTDDIPDDVRALAIEAYNEALEEEIVNENNFDSYFGSIYLNTTKMYNNAEVWFTLAAVIGIFSIIELVNVINGKKKSKQNLSKLTNNELKNLEKELTEEETKTYKKEKLYLTKTYILNMVSHIDIIKYPDVVWLYKQEHRTNGIKTNQRIIVVTKDGVKHTLLMVSYSKKSKEKFEEVLNTLRAKMPKILLGFTEENKKKVKELYDVNKI